MKNFLAQEHEKLSLWWAAISAKEIALYLLLTFALLLPVYLYYAALGITGLTEWYRCLRSFAECGLLFFLTELVTRRSLLHPFWRIGYIPFFSWILIFPYARKKRSNSSEMCESTMRSNQRLVFVRAKNISFDVIMIPMNS